MSSSYSSALLLVLLLAVNAVVGVRAAGEEDAGFAAATTTSTTTATTGEGGAQLEAEEQQYNRWWFAPWEAGTGDVDAQTVITRRSSNDGTTTTTMTTMVAAKSSFSSSTSSSLEITMSLCLANERCAAIGLTQGSCCPTSAGFMLNCCEVPPPPHLFDSSFVAEASEGSGEGLLWQEKDPCERPLNNAASACSASAVKASGSLSACCAALTEIAGVGLTTTTTITASSSSSNDTTSATLIAGGGGGDAPKQQQQQQQSSDDAKTTTTINCLCTPDDGTPSPASLVDLIGETNSTDSMTNALRDLSMYGCGNAEFVNLVEALPCVRPLNFNSSRTTTTTTTTTLPLDIDWSSVQAKSMVELDNDVFAEDAFTSDSSSPLTSSSHNNHHHSFILFFHAAVATAVVWHVV